MTHGRRFKSCRLRGWHPTATEMPDDNENTRCEHCGYEWEYTGHLDMTTCPSCQKKTDVRNIEEEANA